ncbi:UPF0420 protein C16orf58-like protein [Aphelenchoides besseyi]|nr:UPF0420 protein C16orf58-like protein [Aphelenchoides besseyi]
MSKRRSKNEERKQNEEVSNISFLETYNGEKRQLIGSSVSLNSVGRSTVAKFTVERQFNVSNFLNGNWRSTFAEIFLPKGFPNSVTSDYVQYQIFDTIQAFASSLSGTFATAAVLRGVGVGDETATVLAASLSWVLKDGVGMLARILFAWIFGSALDADSKRWRLVADILNDLAFCIDLTCTHTQRHFFIFTVCVSSILRAIVGVAGGGTRMAVIRHQARRENLADVAAKDGSQETLVGIVSLLTSLLLLPLFDNQPSLVWMMFVFLTGVHLSANYAAVRVLQFDIFNEARMRIVANHFIKTGEILSVQEANLLEPLLPSLNLIGSTCHQRRYGCSLIELNDCTKRGFYCDVEGQIRAQFGYTVESKEDRGVLAVKLNAQPTDVLLAAFQLEFLILHSRFPNAVNPIDTVELSKLLTDASWNIDAHLLLVDEFVYSEN